MIYSVDMDSGRDIHDYQTTPGGECPSVQGRSDPSGIIFEKVCEGCQYFLTDRCIYCGPPAYEGFVADELD